MLEEQQQAMAQQQDQTSQMLASMSPEAQAQFNSLPPEQQQAMLQRSAM
jgi:hypothetical protein